MRLTDLHAQLFSMDADYIKHPTDDFSHAHSIEFDCPGCAGKPHSHRIWAPFMGKEPKYPGPSWRASGTGIGDLTFSDDPAGSRSIRMLSRCLSHFNVTNGAIDFYGDSGHATYQPEKRMTDTPETTGPSAETDARSQTEATPKVPAEHPIAESPPSGFSTTHALKYLNGTLHQLFANGHPGAELSHVWVPVPGTSIQAGLMAAVEKMIEEKLAAFAAAKLGG